MNSLIGLCILLGLVSLFLTVVFASQKTKKTSPFTEEARTTIGSNVQLHQLQQVYVLASKDADSDADTDPYQNFVDQWPMSHAMNLKRMPHMTEPRLRQEGIQNPSIKALCQSFQSGIMPTIFFAEFASHVAIWQEMSNAAEFHQSSVSAIFDATYFDKVSSETMQKLRASFHRLLPCERPLYGHLCGPGAYFINGHMARFFLQQLQGSMAKDFLSLELFLLETLKESKSLIQIEDYRDQCPDGVSLIRKADDLRKLLKKDELASINQA